MQFTVMTYTLSKLTAKNLPYRVGLPVFVPATEPKAIDVPSDLMERKIASLGRTAYLVSLI